MDASALEVMMEMIENYEHRGIIVCVVKLTDRLRADFKRAGIFSSDFYERVYENTHEAVCYAQEKISKQMLEQDIKGAMSNSIEIN